MSKLDPKAVASANEKLWKDNPELAGRQLGMGPEDTAYRKEWMKNYREAEEETPKPPPPQIKPEPVIEPLPTTVASGPCVSCGSVADMTHEEKMEEAIKRANLGPEIMEELGDIKTLVATMVIVCGVLVAIAATGYGAIAEGIALGLIIIGAYMSGSQIGEGINSMLDFYQKTRCDRAKTPEDLDSAGKSFADGIAKMGVGGLNLLLSLVGGKKAPAKAKKPPPPPPPKKTKLGLGLKNSDTDYVTWSKQKGFKTYGELSGKGTFPKQIDEAMNAADEIHFNLKGVDVKRTSGKLNEYGEPYSRNYTNYELHLAKTKYRDKVIWHDDSGKAMPKGWMPEGF